MAEAIFRNRAHTKEATANICWQAASAELCDQYCLKVFLNWLATKCGFPLYKSSMHSAKQAPPILPGGWPAFEHIYPFYAYLEESAEHAVQRTAALYLEGSPLQPKLEYAGLLYMQTMVSTLEFAEGGKPVLKPADKARGAGEFYTPGSIVEYCLKLTRFADGGKTLLDPACGTGNFLLGALAQTNHCLDSLSLLNGLDIDGKAISIARVLLLLACSQELERKARNSTDSQFNAYLKERLHRLSKQLKIADATLPSPNLHSTAFDIVVGNPPYISFGSRNQKRLPPSHDRFLRGSFPAASQYKIRMHSIFQELALKLAALDGEVVLLLPDAFLTGAYYERLRRYIESESRIVSLTELPESVFKDAVAGRWCVAHYRKEAKRAPHMVTVRRIGQPTQPIEEFALNHDDLRSADKGRFRLLFNSRDLSICKALDQLPPLASAFRGHTGIRARGGQRSIISDRRESASFRRGLISGSQVQPHQIQWRGHYLNIDPSLLFGGGFDERIVGPPKVLLRQTADRLVAAVDNDGLYHLNNVHAFASVDKHDDRSAAFLAALMNSRLWLYLYQLKSREQKRALAQIDIEMVESLPLPRADTLRQNAIGNAVTSLFRQTSSDLQVLRAIDRAVYDLYGLPDEEIGHIEMVTACAPAQNSPACTLAQSLPASAEALDLLQSVQCETLQVTD